MSEIEILDILEDKVKTSGDGPAKCTENVSINQHGDA